MRWTDSRDIAIKLSETYPDVDPKNVRYTDLHNWVVGLPGFEDRHDRGGEKILEAIQMAWIEESD